MRRITWGSTEDFFVRLSWYLRKNLNFRAQIPWQMIMKVIYVKFMVAKIQSPYCPITRWENYAMVPIVSFFINFELFFSLSLAIAIARAAVPVKPRVIVWRWWWPKWKFFFRRRLCRKSRPLLCYGQKSTTYGKGALLCVLHLGWRPIHFQWFQRAAATQSARKSFM